MKLPGQYKVQLKALVAEVKNAVLNQYKEILSENEWLRQQNDVLIKENDSAKVNKTFEQAVVRSSVLEPVLEDLELLPVRSSDCQKLILEPAKQGASWQEPAIYKAQKLLSDEASNDNASEYSFAEYLAKFSKRYDADLHEANNLWTYLKNHEEEKIQTVVKELAFDEVSTVKELIFDESKAFLPSFISVQALATCTALSAATFSFSGTECENAACKHDASEHAAPSQEVIDEPHEVVQHFTPAVPYLAEEQGVRANGDDHGHLDRDASVNTDERTHSSEGHDGSKAQDSAQQAQSTDYYSSYEFYACVLGSALGSALVSACLGYYASHAS